MTTGSPPDRRHDLAGRIRKLLGPFLRPQTFSAGQDLWHEGEEGGLLVLLDSGRVKAYRTLQDGSTATLYLFGAGDIFGFLPFLDGRPYPASAMALTDVKALVMPRADLVAAFERDPHLGLAMLSLLATRLREAFDRIELLSRPESLPRVAAALRSLLAEGQRPAVLELPLRSSEMATAVGVTPESFSRALTRLVRSGVLHRLGPRRFQVLDLAALERAASEGALHL